MVDRSPTQTLPTDEVRRLLGHRLRRTVEDEEGLGPERTERVVRAVLRLDLPAEDRRARLAIVRRALAGIDGSEDERSVALRLLRLTARSSSLFAAMPTGRTTGSRRTT